MVFCFVLPFLSELLSYPPFWVCGISGVRNMQEWRSEALLYRCASRSCPGCLKAVSYFFSLGIAGVRRYGMNITSFVTVCAVYVLNMSISFQNISIYLHRSVYQLAMG